MILYSPVRFDGNEWFLLISGLLLWSFILWLPKRFNLLFVLMIWILNHLLAELADFSLALPPPDLYDFNDWAEYEYFDLVLYLFLYPPVAYLMLYYYDKWKFRGWLFGGYILLWSAFTTGLEGLAAAFQVFTYKGWLLIYSFPAYILIYLLNVWLYHFVKKQVPLRSI